MHLLNIHSLSVNKSTLDPAGLGTQSAAFIRLYGKNSSKRVSSPSFLKAQLQRGNLLLKQGRLDEAESDYKKVVR